MTATRRHLGNGAPTLEQQVAAALADDNVAADKLEALIDKIEGGIRAAEADAARQREQAMDPSISPDLRDARSRLEDSIFLVGRLKTLRPRLERRLAEVLDAEQHARWLADYAAVKIKRDRAVEVFNRYPTLLADLLDMLYAARDADEECDRVNATAPSGEPRRLASVQLTARALPTHNVEFPSIADRLVLPDFQSARMLWPPQQINPVLFAKPESYDPRFSDAWGSHRDAAQQQAREQAEREREQFEHDAEVAQSDGGRIPVWWRNGHNRTE